MLTRSTGRVRLLALSYIAFLLFQLLLAGCSTAPQSTARSGAPATPSSQFTQVPVTQPASTAQAVSPAARPSELQGPANFLLATPFHFSTINGATMDNNGATTPLDAGTVKTEITGEMERLLFVMDSGDNLKVYSPGTSPVTAQLTYQPDGNISIGYTQTVDSDAGSITILFSGVLSKEQITVSYEQQYTPSMLINAEASNVDVSFTTRVRWVAPDQIPAAPANGQYQLTGSGDIVLSWSAGQNAVAYNVYRLISDQNQQFQLLATVKGVSYTDSSEEAKQNIHDTKGITYAIFSVGPTGVENPGGIVISV